MKALSLALFALVVSWASTASAATVTVTLDARFHDFNEVRYVAAAGETNNLTVAYAADARSVTVTDPGAVITAMGSCTSLNSHSAICKAPNPPFPIAGEFVQSTRAELGDMNDRAITTRPGPNVIGGIDAFGGPGNDVLIGSPTDDRLDGGGGTDTITGGDGPDRISDGDTTALDADTMDGGAGDDEISYRQRTGRVVVDLSDSGPDGAPGENDTVRGFESATGGKGDDRLIGNRRDNRLDGGAGRNRLAGGRGDDFLLRATGPLADCGRGDDAVTRPRRTTRLPGACERLFLRLRRGVLADTGAAIDPSPDRSGGRFGLDVSCPDLDGEPVGCSGTVRIRRRSDGALLGTGRLRGGGEDRDRVLPVNLTALGDRLWGDGRRQLATTRVSGRIARTTAWTIGF
jgi:Ca2+-binding RTX toxin-like protein